MDETGSQTTQEVEDEVSKVTEPVFDIVPEDIKKPHVSDNVKESSMKKHGGQKWEPLLDGGKLSRNFGVGISHGNNAIEEESLFQMGTLGELPEEGKDVETDEPDVDDRKSL
jgi:hypothetical protein